MLTLLIFLKNTLDTFVDNDIWRERNKPFRRLIEREPVHTPDGNRIENWPGIGLYTSPDPQEKKKILKKLGCDFGEHSHRLITSKNTDYYNQIH